jgi:hypothetical protein
MNVFEAIGFTTTILGTALFIALLLILAAFGAVIAWVCFMRGVTVIEQDIRDGLSIRHIIRGGVRSTRA